MRRRTFLGAAGVTALSGCVNLAGTGGSDGPITVGAIEPLSGPFTPWGRTHRDGLAFAVEEINADGGVDGRELSLTVTDTASDPTDADSIFRRMVEQEGAVAVTGPVSSDVGIRTARTAGELEVPLLLHMAGSDDVLSRDTRYTFRVGLVPAPTTMRAQAQLVADAGYRSVGAVIADYAWGRSVESGIDRHFPVDVTTRTAPVGADDFKPFIRQLPEDLEMMIATGHPPGAVTIMRQQFQLGYEPAVTTESGFPPALITDALGADATRGVTHTHLTDVYSERFRSVASRYAEATGSRMGTHEGYGYVTGQLIAEAIRRAGSTDPAELAETVRAIEFDTLYATPIRYTDWGELRDQRQIYSGYQAGAPEHYPEADYRLTEVFRTDPLAPFNPGSA
jgi:ABC-type branched-subunit amino acid transport system substrate-binding protein